jgi:hypothetical protein
MYIDETVRVITYTSEASFLPGMKAKYPKAPAASLIFTMLIFHIFSLSRIGTIKCGCLYVI